jgi:hypothetical protein
VLAAAIKQHINSPASAAGTTLAGDEDLTHMLFMGTFSTCAQARNALSAEHALRRQPP